LETRPYGTTGRTTSIIGLGGAFLTASSFADGVATVRRALDLGVTYFDTSPMYCRGASQAVLGEALEGVTSDCLLATKLGYFSEPLRFHSLDALLTQFGENLRLLRRDHVDILQLHEADSHHWWSTDTALSGRLDKSTDYEFASAPALAAMSQIKQQGACSFVGISGNTADNMQRVLEHIDVDTFLLAFNYDLIRRGARRVLPIAEKKGMARMVGAIFQRGLASSQPTFFDTPPVWMTPKLLEAYRTVYGLQEQSGMTFAEIGVRFMVAQSEMNVIIIGAKSPDEIEECVRAAEAGPLPPEMVEQIEQIGLET
jgi:L-galactose dehydrogenase